MTDLSTFPITHRWPAANPEVLQLYSFPTPNGKKVGIMLEETGLPYEGHRVSLSDSDVKSDAFVSLNPNGKIPAIIDPNGPDGKAMGLFESGAILVYLAQKTGQFGGADTAERMQILQWVMFQMGGAGPMFGQLGFFVKFAGREIEDPRPRDRYIAEAGRLLGVLERRMAGRDWIADSYSIADMALCPWLGALDFYGARDMVGWGDCPNVQAYFERFMNRPAVQRAQDVPTA